MAETQPLLSAVAEQNGHAELLSGELPKDVIIVEFDAKGDAENPITWPGAYKRGIIALLAFMAFVVTFTCISVVPVANRIVSDLNKPDHRPNKSASVLLVTIWELGEAAGPLFIGPLSEIFGRYRVLIFANALFIAFTVFAACCQDTYLFIAVRCLTGAVVASNVLNPAIVGDIYAPDQRGSAMSLIMLAPLIGGSTGPAISGAITETLGWRAVLWISAAIATVAEILLLAFFRETYEVTILSQRARSLQKELPPDSKQVYRTIFDVKDSTAKPNAWISLTRPFHVLSSSLVIQLTCLFSGMTFTYFYIMSTTLPNILEQFYHLTPAQIGLSFMTFSAGSFLMVLICNRAIDGLYIYLRDRDGDKNGGEEERKGKPEYRLPLVIIGAVTLPLTVTAYGWIVSLHAPLWVFLVCVGSMGATMMLAFLPVTSYVVDALGLYSASGMTAIIVTRCLMGTFFPLTTAPLVDRFGYGWGFTILGGICLSLAPIPMVLLRYGEKWRGRSRYTSEEAK